jgi:hypothetical protein
MIKDTVAILSEGEGYRIGFKKPHGKKQIIDRANAKKICGPDAIFEPAHNHPPTRNGFFDHYHKAGHGKAHSFFGFPVWA